MKRIRTFRAKGGSRYWVTDFVSESQGGGEWRYLTDQNGNVPACRPTKCFISYDASRLYIAEPYREHCLVQEV